MSTGSLIRWSGLVSVVAGALYALAALLHPVGEDLAAISSPNWVPAHLLFWVSVILMLFCLVGLCARQLDKMGWLGLVSFVLAFVGTALVGGILLMVATVIPIIAIQAPALLGQAMTPPPFAAAVFTLSFGLGYILFGVATARAGVTPRWSGFMLIIGVAFFMIAEAALFGPTLSHGIVTLGDVVFGLGLVWMGYTLWSEKRVLTRKGEAALVARGAP